MNNQLAFLQNFFQNMTLLVLDEISCQLLPRLCPSPEAELYSKTCIKRPLKKKTKGWLIRSIIAYCRSKVLQNAQHSAILLTCIKLQFVIKIFVLTILNHTSNAKSN